MTTRNQNIMTAALSAAVMFLALTLGGCVLPRHIDEVKAEIRETQRQNDETQAMIARIDSTVKASEEANAALRADVNFTVDELRQEIATLLVNYNELMAVLQQIASDRRILLPSAGSQSQKPPTDTARIMPPPEQVKPAIDCDAAYDEAFILVRRGEYQTAIDSFNTYIRNCPNHESVENAYYWIGESYYALEKYVEAVSQFDLLINTYKSSPNIGRALYKLARSYQELERIKEAKEVYQRLVDELDGTLEAEQARERLKELK